MLVQTFKIELKQILGGNHAPFKIFYDKFLEKKMKGEKTSDLWNDKWRIIRGKDEKEQKKN